MGATEKAVIMMAVAHGCSSADHVYRYWTFRWFNEIAP